MPAAIPLVVLAGSAVAGAIFSSALTVGLISIGLSVVGTLAQILLAPKPPGAPKPQFADGKQTLRQPVPPRVRGYGRGRLGGGVAYYNTSDGGEELLVATVHLAHQIDAIEEYWLADQLVILDEDGWVQSSPYQIGPEPGRVNIETHAGEADQAASANLLANGRTDWSADHRLAGLAYTVVTYRDGDPEHHPEIYPNGPPPLTVVGRWSLVWDPRDPGQDRDDEATFLWSDNYALALLDWLTRREGAAQVPVGTGLPWSRIDVDSFAAAADVCDQPIDLAAGGTEPRWRLWGAYELTEPRKQVLGDLLLAGQARLLVGPDGRIGLSVGAPGPAATVTITDDQVLEYHFPPAATDLDRVNLLKAQYLSEAHRWAEVEAGIQSDPMSIAQFGEQAETVRLRFVPSESQAQRIARAELKKLDARWRGTIRTTLYGMDAWGQRWVGLVLSELAINQIFEVQGMTLDRATMTVVLRVQSYDGWWDWDAASDEADPPPVPVDDTGDDPLPPPEDVAVAIESRAINATTRVPIGIVSWDPDGNPDGRYGVQVRWRIMGGTWRIIQVALGEAEAETPPLEDGAQYEAQARYVGQRGTPSAWSDTVLYDAIADPVAPGAPVGFSAVLVPGVDEMADLAATAPNDQHFAALTFYRDTGSGFGSEVPVAGPLYGSSGQLFAFRDNPAAGTWWYRAKAENASGITSAPTAGTSVTTAS